MEGPARAHLNGPYVWGAPLGLTETPPERLGATFSVEYSFDVRFTFGALDPDNELLADVIDADEPAKVLAVLDADVVARRPQLPAQLAR